MSMYVMMMIQICLTNFSIFTISTSNGDTGDVKHCHQKIKRTCVFQKYFIFICIFLNLPFGELTIGFSSAFITFNTCSTERHTMHDCPIHFPARTRCFPGRHSRSYLSFTRSLDVSQSTSHMYTSQKHPLPVSL